MKSKSVIFSAAELNAAPAGGVLKQVVMDIPDTSVNGTVSTKYLYPYIMIADNTCGVSFLFSTFADTYEYNEYLAHPDRYQSLIIRKDQVTSFNPMPMTSGIVATVSGVATGPITCWFGAYGV